MHDKHLYEYAVIRVVPKVERGEFINAGLILFSKRQKYLRVETAFDREKLTAICPDCDFDQLEENLRMFTEVGRGETKHNPIAAEDPSERFRWLTAEKSSSIQTSRPHSGFAEDLDKTFERLFEELVV